MNSSISLPRPVDVIITGAGGFIGKALFKRLVANGYQVLPLSRADGDVSDPLTWEKLPVAKVLVHLAAQTFVPDSWKNPGEFIKNNVLASQLAVNWCHENNAQMIFSSAYIYGIPKCLPICESDLARPNNPYALSKFLAEQCCEFASSYLGVNVVILRLFNIYGPGQDDKFLIPALVKQLSNSEIRVMDLTPRRDYVYLTDVVEAFVLAINAPPGLHKLNIGSGKSNSVAEIIAALQSAAGTSLPVVSAGQARPNEIPDVVADNTEATNMLGWSPKYDLTAGVHAMLNSEESKKESAEHYVPINKGNYSMDTIEREAQFSKYRGEGWDDEYAKYRSDWFDLPSNQKVESYPLLVDIELASICNLNCPMCYTVTEEFKQKVNATLMNFELYKKIIDEIGGNVPAIRLSLRGESLIHKKFVDCIRYAKEHRIKEVSTLTNAAKLTLDFFKVVAEAGIDWITVSADGVGDTYERIRKPIRFQYLIDNLRSISAYKKEYGLHRPVVKVQGIWPAIVESGVDEYYNIFSSCADLVAFNPLIDYLSNDKDIKYLEEFTCPQQYQRLVIGADGLVMKCSNDEENTEIIGDINIESVYQVWHGEKMQAIRNMHLQPRGFMQSEVCRKCYLPRKTEDEATQVCGRTLIVPNYVNRVQVIGE